MLPFVCPQGSTFTLALEAVSGDVGEAAVRAALKPAVNGRVPSAGTPESAVFSATAVAHVDAEDATSGPGWHLTLSDEQTQALAPGRYFADARIGFPDGVDVLTQTVAIDVKASVTGAG